MQTPFGPFRIADLLDILVVTTLVYTAVAWIRRTQAAFVAAGLLILGALYATALVLDLRLTSWILQGFFAIFVVIVVVIFQEELRQLFEWLAVWSLRRGSPLVRRSAPDILVQALTELARERTGALVVLPGTQPIERHVRGGLELDGKVSVPLLRSIFDPHSPGHDGAVILEGDHVRRFAAHLPLSADFPQLAGVGTRHSAALGLAELTDALCIVVSEERGTISVAHNGRLRRLAEPAELGAVVGEFLAATSPAPSDVPLRTQLLRESWLQKVASLAIVTVLWWGLVPGSRPMEQTFRVAVRAENLPSTLELAEIDPAEVEVTLTGLRRDFYLFNPRRLDVSIDAALARAGRRTFRILDQNVRHPKELTVEDIEPHAVRLVVRPAGEPLRGPGPTNGGS